mmetsp:Transcript_78248/g.247280  ORF Transcript_78248/g.247280 Transcript_78248/m.247280 type:complete len:205 (+) Transcript_78248:266-880(+)
MAASGSGAATITDSWATVAACGKRACRDHWRPSAAARAAAGQLSSPWAASTRPRWTPRADSSLGGTTRGGSAAKAKRPPSRRPRRSCWRPQLHAAQGSPAVVSSASSRAAKRRRARPRRGRSTPAVGARRAAWVSASLARGCCGLDRCRLLLAAADGPTSGLAWCTWLACSKSSDAPLCTVSGGGVRRPVVTVARACARDTHAV